MPRGFTASQITELAKRVKAPVYFIDLDLAAGHVRVWNGVGDITALSQTWKGLGEPGIIQGLGNDATLKAGSITLTASGIPSDGLTAGIIASTRSVRYQGRPVTIYMGFLNPDTGALLHDPTAIWDGFADVLTFRLGATISAALTCEHFDSHLRRSNGERMTPEAHNLAVGTPSPRDLFFEPQDRLMGRPQPLIEG